MHKLLSEHGRMPIRKVFTLIELLVVIVIISILMSLLLPSLKKAREKAKSALCVSNLKQCGTSMINYSTDYDDCARTWDGGMSEYVDKWWADTMMSYGYVYTTTYGLLFIRISCRPPKRGIIF